MATALSPEDVGSRLRARFGQDVVAFEVQHGHPVATVSTERYRDVCRFLRDEPEFDCTYCDFTAGVDFGPERGFEVVTHLYSLSHRHNVRIKVLLSHEEPTCPTVSDLFPTSDWHERETREMFGIRFEGQPLRKDFPLMSREAKPWPGLVEGEDVEDEE